MPNSPKSRTRIPMRVELDARAIVPVEDEIGGTVVYHGGRAAYYVLNGEWFQAVTGVESGRRSGPFELMTERGLSTNVVSTS